MPTPLHHGEGVHEAFVRVDRLGIGAHHVAHLRLVGPAARRHDPRNHVVLAQDADEPIAIHHRERPAVCMRQRRARGANRGIRGDGGQDPPLDRLADGPDDHRTSFRWLRMTGM
jgi:hypothetical protein